MNSRLNALLEKLSSRVMVTDTDDTPPDVVTLEQLKERWKKARDLVRETLAHLKKKQLHSRFIVPPPLLLIRSYLRQGDGRYGFHDTAYRIKLLCLVWMIADFAHVAVCAPARPGALPLHRGCTYVASATFGPASVMLTCILISLTESILFPLCHTFSLIPLRLLSTHTCLSSSFSFVCTYDDSPYPVKCDSSYALLPSLTFVLLSLPPLCSVPND